MQEIPHSIVTEAEILASKGAKLPEILKILRKLSLDDFGRLMFSMPNPDFPEISEKLPAMASAEIQKSWTGVSGTDLLKQTLAFTKQLEVNAIRHAEKKLKDAVILDFGCGYGRFIRMLYYFTDPSNIWAIDAWDKSLEKCHDCRVAANFAQSERTPRSLPMNGEKVDIGFSFSVFTHLAPSTAKACLSAIRDSMNLGGVYLATIRPVEFWLFKDKMNNTQYAKAMMDQHNRDGFAYVPHNGSEGETYGDLSCVPSFMEQPGWKMIGYDSSIMDSMQTTVILRAI